MPEQYDRPSREVNKITKKLFKGKEGKAFRKQVIDYLRTTIPQTGAYDAGRGMLPQLGGLLQQGINYQQSVLPAAQDAVQRGLRGEFFDIAPWQRFAERNLQRNTVPEIAQTFATLNAANSSDTSGQIANAVRDTYFGLGQQGAQMNFEAQNALVNQGGLGNYFNAAQQPANLAFSGTNQLFGTDLAARQAEQSLMPGGASLWPSFLGSGGTFDAMSQQASRGRIADEAE